MNIKFDSRTPLYLQIIDYFKVKIASGVLKAGEEVPSRRELAKRFKVNPNTVQRAYKEMEEQGLLYTDRNMPSKITDDEHLIYEVREELLMTAVDHLVESVKPINVPLNELIPLIEKRYELASEEDKDD